MKFGKLIYLNENILTKKKKNKKLKLEREKHVTSFKLMKTKKKYNDVTMTRVNQCFSFT